MNRSSYFAGVNANKLSLGIDLRKPKGFEVIRRLVDWADIVAESFSPGVIERLGLGYNELARMNPKVIMARASMLGASGPLSKAKGFGFQLTGFAGFTDATGWPDRPPTPPYGPYTDAVAPRFLAAAVILALMHREATGKGACIDLSQHEAGVYFTLPMILEYQKNGKKLRQGNSDPSFCPNGVYPCMGTDRWLALSVENDRQWQSLSDIMEAAWSRGERFASFVGRKQNEAEIDARIAAWTEKHPAERLVRLLQQREIPASIVANSQDIASDPQLAHRRAIWRLETEDLGQHAVFSQGFIMSGRYLEIRARTPS